MGHVTNRAIVLLYCGTEMPQDVIFDAISSKFGSYMVDGSKPSVVILDSQAIAETLASANFKLIQAPDGDKTPFEQAVTVIGGMFPSELRKFGGNQSDFVLKVVGKVKTAKHSSDIQDVAFMNALRVLNSTSFPTGNATAYHWHYTKDVHTAIQNTCRTLNIE